MRSISRLKIISMVLVVLLVASAIAFAGGQTETSADQTDGFTIGFDIFNSSHPWAVEAIKFTGFVANSLGAEIDIAFNELDPENQIANVENFISRGVDGVVLIPLNPNIMLRVAPMMERAQIPWVIYEIEPPPEVVDQLAGFSQYVGFVGHSNANTGANAAEILLNAGRRNAVILTGDRGTQMHEERTDGFSAAFAEGGGRVLARQYNLLTADESSNAMSALLAAHPNVDAVYGTGATFGMGAIEALRRAGRLNEVDVVVTDLAPDLLEMMQDGTLSGASGGHWVTPGFATLRLIAALQGEPLGTNRDHALFNMVALAADDVPDYISYHLNRPPFSSAELEALLPALNPGAAFSDLEQIASQFSIHNTVERREADRQAGRALPEY